jgi:hypothetical protein
MFDVPKKLVVALLEKQFVDIPSLLNYYSGISSHHSLSELWLQSNMKSSKGII